MNRKVKIGSMTKYTTTDGDVFTENNAEARANSHQNYLDTMAIRKDFRKYLRSTFDAEFPSRVVLDNKIARELADAAPDDAGELADCLLDIFAFIGPVRWKSLTEFISNTVYKKEG